MRVCLATPLYPPESGGPATFAKALEEGLEARGWSGETVRFSAVRRYPPGIRHLIYMYRVWQAARRADAVLALDPVSTGLPALLAARLAGKPFFLRIAGDYAWEQGTARFGVTDTLDRFTCKSKHPIPVRLLRAVERFVADSALRIIVPSAYLAKIVHLWDIPRERITVAYNAAPRVGNVEAEKRNAPYLISAGRLVAWKGMKELVSAFAGVRQEQPDLELVIVGEGPERERIVAAAKEAGIEDAVTLLGAKTREETLALVKGARGFVLNTRYEGLSHAILEALALGTPVATTPTGGNAELIEEGKTGLLFSPNDERGMVEAMRELSGNAALRNELSKNGLALVKSYAHEAMIDAVARTLAPRPA